MWIIIGIVHGLPIADVSSLQVFGRRADARGGTIVTRTVFPDARPVPLSEREFVNLPVFVQVNPYRGDLVRVIALIGKLSGLFYPFVQQISRSGNPRIRPKVFLQFTKGDHHAHPGICLGKHPLFSKFSQTEVRPHQTHQGNHQEKDQAHQGKGQHEGKSSFFTF